MFDPEHWPLPSAPVDLSDEAAAQIAQFLMDLALWFESTHLAQIRRHDQAMRPLPDYDPSQLELFEPF
jgi:hypothetical protein